MLELLLTLCPYGKSFIYILFLFRFCVFFFNPIIEEKIINHMIILIDYFVFGLFFFFLNKSFWVVAEMLQLFCLYLQLFLTACR